MIISRKTLANPLPEPLPYDMAPIAEPEESSGGFTIAQILAMVRAHLWVSAAIFVLLACLSFVAIKMLPKVYFATATLILNPDDTDLLAGRNFQAGQYSSYFPTQIELINNNVVLRPVADRLQLQKDERFTGGFQGDPKTLNDIVVINLRSSLDVQPGRGSQMMYISAKSDDPVMAATLANAVAEEYLSQTNERTNKPAAKRADRYNAQTAELKSNLDEKQARMAEFRQKYGMVDMGQDSEQSARVATELEEKVRRAQEVRRQLESQSVNIRADGILVQETPEEGSLRTKLSELEGQLTKASATKGAQHPQIQGLQREIEVTRQAIQSNVERRIQMARTLESQFQGELAAQRRRTLDRKLVQDEGAKLAMELRLAEEAYASALRGLDAVEFASEGNYQDVELVSRAEPPVTAAKPNKLKLFLAALAASMAAAIGLPFVYELFLSRRVRCRDDLERSFKIITLAEFGPIRPTPATA